MLNPIKYYLLLKYVYLHKRAKISSKAQLIINPTREINDSSKDMNAVLLELNLWTADDN